MQINIYYFKSCQTLQWQGHVLLCICQHGNISKDSNNSYCTKLSSLCLYCYDQHVTRYYQHKLIQQKNIEENPINFSIPLLYSFYRSMEVCVLFMPSNSAYQFKKRLISCRPTSQAVFSKISLMEEMCILWSIWFHYKRHNNR